MMQGPLSDLRHKLTDLCEQKPSLDDLQNFMKYLDRLRLRWFPIKQANQQKIQGLNFLQVSSVFRNLNVKQACRKLNS